MKHRTVSDPQAPARGRLKLAGPVPVTAAVVVVVWAGAGDLNPPAGPIEPTMKSLDQVEPRSLLTPSSGGTTANALNLTRPRSLFPAVVFSVPISPEPPRLRRKAKPHGW